MLRLLTAGLAALVVSGQSVAAQTPVQSDLVEVLSRADDEGQFLRITTDDSLRIQGYVRRLDDRAIRLGGGVTELQLIERVELRIREAGGSKSGAVLGAVIVGGAFGFLGFFVSVLCRYDCGVTTRLAPLIGAAAGGIIGAIVGTAVGGAAEPGETEWTLLWSR